MIIVGMFIVYGVNYVFVYVFEGWCWMFGGVIVLVMVLLFGVFLLFEFLRFLVRIGKNELV